MRIIPPNKNIDEDEYARYDGFGRESAYHLESRRLVKVLPETTAPNGPPSCEAKDSLIVR